MRDTLVPQTGSKEFKVLVGGTDVATAGTATFALGTAAPAGFTATFEDDGAAAGEAISGTEITLPEITNNKAATRYYTGWTKDGGTTVLAPGAKVTLDADTKFTAVHFGKGDVNQDEWVDYNDAGYIYLYEAEQYDTMLEEGCPQFWNEDGTLEASIADVNGDEWVDYNDAGYIYLYEAEQFDTIIEEGCPQFWED